MSESAQRQAWRAYDGADEAMTEISFGPARIKVARPTVAAWNALEAVLNAHDYAIRDGDTYGYYPRNVEGTTARSLHAFGIAIDVNAETNPIKKTPSRRKVWFSEKRTQLERGQDVRLNAADTDMTPEMIDDVRAIRTIEQKPVFGWGGDWINKKDPMHFHIDVSPQELAVGLDPLPFHSFNPGDDDDRPDDDSHHDHGHSNPSEWGDEMLLEAETIVSSSQVARFRPFLNFIAHHEGTAKRPGGGYDTSLAYGRFSGGEKKLSLMTLDQIEALQGKMLNHPENHFNSSALGRYQIVRKTLRGLKAQFGLRGSDLYSADLQDRLAVALIKRRGRDVTGLRNEWASLKNISAAAILAKYDEQLPVSYPDPDPEPGSDDALERFVELLKRLGLGAGLAIGNGQFEDPPPQLMLKPGDRGPDVKALQEALSSRNYQVGKIDGVYGTLTTGAVAAFQVDYKVPADVPGSVDNATWAALREAPGRPLSDDRANTTASDLRRMGSRTVADADNSRIVAMLTSMLGVLGLGNYAITGGTSSADAAPAAKPSVDLPMQQQIANAVSGFPTGELKTFFGLDTKQMNNAAIKILDNGKLVGPAPVTGTQTSIGVPNGIGPELQSLIATGANLLLPGAGGSLAILALGIASHFFGTRVINRRVQDQRNGSNIGAHLDRT